MKKILFSLFVISALLITAATATGAYFTSLVSVSDNNFSTGTWYTGPEVVINELMWMGSWKEPSGPTDPNDEWLELRNMTGSAKDISGWQITRISGTPLVENLMITLPASQSIAANGYYLISKKAQVDSAINVAPNYTHWDLSLSNTSLRIKLYRGNSTNPANLVDTAGNGGAPLAGLNPGSPVYIPKQAMARNNVPGDGTLATNWYTTTNPLANDIIYWKVEGSNYGTPGGPNV